MVLSRTVSELEQLLCAPDRTPTQPQFWGCSRCTRSLTLASTSTWALSYSAVKLFLKNSNVFEHGTWSLRTLRSLQCLFPIDDILFKSGDIRQQVAKSSEIAQKVWCLGRHFFWGGTPKFLTQFHKSGSLQNMWQSLLTIGPDSSEIRQRKKPRNYRSIRPTRPALADLIST